MPPDNAAENTQPVNGKVSTTDFFKALIAQNERMDAIERRSNERMDAMETRIMGKLDEICKSGTPVLAQRVKDVEDDMRAVKDDVEKLKWGDRVVATLAVIGSAIASVIGIK